MSSIDARLKDLGIVLPHPAAPIANYAPWTICGSVLTISGQLPFGADGKLDSRFTRQGGAPTWMRRRRETQRANARSMFWPRPARATGDLACIRRCQRLGGFIAAAAGFHALPAVMNGASDLVVAILGEPGRHARSTVGVAELPLGAAVEVEASFEIEAS